MAMKVIRKSHSVRMGQTAEQTLAEARMMSQLRHPCVMALHEVVDCGDLLVMSMDFATGGDLQDLLRRFGRLHESAVRAMMSNILEGLAFLHSKGLLHRDLKPANVLLMGGPIAEEKAQKERKRQMAAAGSVGGATSGDGIRMTVICAADSLDPRGDDGGLDDGGSEGIEGAGEAMTGGIDGSEGLPVGGPDEDAGEGARWRAPACVP